MTTTPPTLLVLAAGMGSRYGGLKQFDPVGPGGETIIDYSIYDAIRTGFGRVVFLIRRDIENAFKQTFGARFEKHIRVDYLFQELDALPSGFSVPPGRSKPWGTGHAMLMAMGVIVDPFAVINGDDFYGVNSFRVLSAHLRSKEPDYAMVGFTLRNTLSDFGSVARGVCRVDAGDHLVSITELTHIEGDGAGARYQDGSGEFRPLTGDETVSMNMWGFTPSVFAPLQEQMIRFLRERGRLESSEFYIPSVVNDLISADQCRVKVLPTADSWFGVTYREDRPRVVAALRHLIGRGDYPEILWS